MPPSPRPKSSRADRLGGDAALGDFGRNVLPHQQRCSDLRQGGRRLDAVASLAGKPEHTLDIGIEADDRLAIRGEGPQAAPAALDAIDAAIDKALEGSDP